MTGESRIDEAWGENHNRNGGRGGAVVGGGDAVAHLETATRTKERAAVSRSASILFVAHEGQPSRPTSERSSSEQT